MHEFCIVSYAQTVTYCPAGNLEFVALAITTSLLFFFCLIKLVKASFIELLQKIAKSGIFGYFRCTGVRVL